MNTTLFNAIHGLAGKSQILDFLGVFSAEYLAYIVAVAALVAVLMAFPDWKRRFYFYGLLALALILSRGIITEAFRYFYYHPRPFDVFHFTPLIPESGNSFPSGHTTFFFALAGIMWAMNRKWGWWFLGAAALIGVARVFVGVHWPYDILGGAVIGLLSAWASTYLLPPERIKNMKQETTA
ncbi:MAG: phosphatase PAP2 family protein [Patescibacteria group bacterium]|nr:phosphatase PAP2 family protein [Patescibacteria group bacterium]